ncbi:hypothetical protein N7495_003694 [Penicillium taxi]|uniref:uncharacterized protein n=1 Tax=Penicillium taxi TaxID=168475 RepID=UPI002544E581|nr:uncharacterized protein N7495_003694 [Penicillium taxi]KAJ5898950.1 hypothetical protein N7495_003694 [Penicillium taxi]
MIYRAPMSPTATNPILSALDMRTISRITIWSPAWVAAECKEDARCLYSGAPFGPRNHQNGFNLGSTTPEISVPSGADLI